MKRIFSIVILTCATVMLSAQKPKSFVVTDKEGNSPLVESLIFQKDASDEKFSWKTSTESDGYQAGRDIRNLKFIARTNAELQTADSEDIITKLNDESGTNGVDAEAIAVTLKDNPNIKEAFTDDGGNLVVKLEKEDENYNVFPMYGIDDVFSENGESYLPASLSPRQPEMFKASANSGKVAIFNFFSGDNNVKNRLVNKLTEIFRKQHYTVDVYSRHSGSSGSINEFTVDKLNEVISHSSEYSFILIFSHGFVIDGKSYFATGEISKSLTTNYPKPTHFMWVDNMKYITYPASFEVANKECLVYLGSCYGGNYLSTNANKSIIAWKGRNSIAQTHATVIFDKMFSDIWCNISSALESSFKKDPFSPEAVMVVADDAYSGTSYYPDIDTEYMEDAIMDLTNKTTSSQNKGEKGDIFVKKKDFQQVLKLGGTITGEKVGEYFLWVRVKLDPVIQFGGSWTPDPIYVNFKKDNINPNDNVDYVMEDFWVKLPADTPEGIYRVVVQSPTYEGGLKFRETIRQRQPMYIIYSSKLSDNYALPAYSEEDLQFPEIQDANGARVEEMEVAAGTTKEFTVVGYPGHTFSTYVANKEIAQLTLDGNHLTVKGISEGKTYAHITDLDNKLFFVFDITVTKGEDPPTDEYESHKVTTWDTAGNPVSFEKFVASADTEQKYLLRMPSISRRGWCDFTTQAAVEANKPTINNLFSIETSPNDETAVVLKRFSDGLYLQGTSNSNSSTWVEKAEATDIYLVNRIPLFTDPEEQYPVDEMADYYISMDDVNGNHFNNGNFGFRPVLGGWSAYLAYGPIYVVSVCYWNRYGEDVAPPATFFALDGATFTITPPEIFGFTTIDAEYTVTVVGEDLTCTVYYEEARSVTYTLNVIGTPKGTKMSIFGNEVDINATEYVASGIVTPDDVEIYLPAEYDHMTFKVTVNGSVITVKNYDARLP